MIGLIQAFKEQSLGKVWTGQLHPLVYQSPGGQEQFIDLNLLSMCCQDSEVPTGIWHLGNRPVLELTQHAVDASVPDTPVQPNLSVSLENHSCL